MINLANLKAVVFREISYWYLTVEEKCEIARTADSNDLLYALATDKSSEVRCALVNREKAIPNKILGEILLNDIDQEIKLQARRQLLSSINKLEIGHKKMFEKFLTFLSYVFSIKFIETLDTLETRKKAMSAVYLYDMKYGFPLSGCTSFFDERLVFNKTEMERYYSTIGVYNRYEPWSWMLWDVFETLAVYKYLPDDVNEILQKGLFKNEEVNAIISLKEELSIPDSPEKENRWVNILANTLYNLGWIDAASKTGKDFLINEVALATNDSVEDITNAENLLRKVYQDTNKEKQFRIKV